MNKKFYMVLTLITMIGVADFTCFSTGKTINTCTAKSVPNNGTYTRTNYSVTIYTESGHSKGTFAVYLHNSMKYIRFYNTWICIQGKSRFAYCGNWYIIR